MLSGLLTSGYAFLIDDDVIPCFDDVWYKCPLLAFHTLGIDAYLLPEAGLNRERAPGQPAFCSSRIMAAMAPL